MNSEIISNLRKRISSERFRRLGKETGWILLGQGLMVVGALVGVRLLTSLLTPENYGELTLGMTVTTLVQVVALGPLGNGATRFYASASEIGALPSYFAALRSMVMLVTSGIIITALLVGVGMLAMQQFHWVALGSVALIFAILSGYDSILSGVQNAARQRAIVALHQGVATWGRFLIAAGLMLWLGASSTVAMMGYGVAMIFVIISEYFFFQRTIPDRVCSEPTEQRSGYDWKQKIFAYSWPFATWGVLGWFNLVADRWALQLFSSTYEVGLYAVLFQLGFYPLSLVANAGTQLLSPIYFQRAGDATDVSRMVKIYALGLKVTMYAILFSCIIFAITALLHRQIFSFLVAPEYRDISYLLPWATLASGFIVSAQFCSIVLQADQSTQLLILPKNISNVLGVIFVIIGALLFGLPGVVGSKIISAGIHLGWVLVLFKRKYSNLQAMNSESSR